MKPLESAIEKRACKRVQMEIGVESVKLVKKKGLPDRAFLIPGGRPLLIEFKREGEIPDGYQAIVHARWSYLGYDVEVHDNADEAFAAVERACWRAIAARRPTRRALEAAPVSGTLTAVSLRKKLGRAVP